MHCRPCMHAWQAVSHGSCGLRHPGDVHCCTPPLGLGPGTVTGMHAQSEWPSRLRDAMDQAGLKGAADLARASGLNYSVTHRWLAGEGVPSVDNLRAAAKPLGVPLLELMVWAGLITREEARLRDPGTQLTPEEALAADRTLTAEGRRAGLASLEGLRKAFGTARPKERKRRTL